MKTTRKLIVALVLVMSILMTLAVAVIPASAADTTARTPVYLKPNSNWKSSSAWFAVYYWNNSGNGWARMVATDSTNNTYVAFIPSGYTNYKYVRMNSGKNSTDWDSKWDESSNLTVPAANANNCYSVSGWTNGGGSWSKVNTNYKTVYFKNTSNWSTVYCHAWVENGERDADITSWNGLTMTNLGNGIWSCQLPEIANRVIFNKDSSNKTGDLTISTANCQIYDYSTNTWGVYHTGGTATCTAKANCSVCGTAYGDKSTSNHTGTIVNGGTAAVHSKYNCCGATVSTTHAFDDGVVTAPTCTTGGYTTYTCSCGYNYKGNETEAAHTPASAVTENSVESTCTVAGSYDSVVYCSVEGCGAEISRETVTLELADHSYNEETGLCVCGKEDPDYCAHEYTYDCDKVCIHCHTESRPEAEHSITHVEANAAGCTTNGNIEYWSCSICNYVWTDEALTQQSNAMSIVVPAAHNWVDANCTTPKTCSVCHETEGEALGHNMITDAAVAPGCESTGLTEGSHCSRCDHKVAQETVDALGHDMIPDAAVAPGCESTGLTEGSHCSRCDHEVAQEVVPATGHTFVDGKCACNETRGTVVIYFENNWLWTDVHFYFWNDSTNGIGGTWPGVKAEKVDTKKNDHDVYFVELPADATGFIINGVKNDGSGKRNQTPDIKSGWYDCIIYKMDWKNDANAVLTEAYHDHEAVDGKTPTCTEAGYSAYKCGNDTIVTTIPATGHSYETSVTTQPGCETTGVKTFTCSCGYSYTEEIAATGHTYETEVTAPTCTEAGYTTYTCSCGDSYKVDGDAATGHTIVDGACACGHVATFEEAIAGTGTVTLTDNVTYDGTVALVSGVKINLNGKNLTVTGDLITFAAGQLTDSVGGGKIYVAKAGIAYKDTNDANVLVYNAEGYYSFKTIKKQSTQAKVEYEEANKIAVDFRPAFVEDGHKVSFANAEAAGLEMFVTITWGEGMKEYKVPVDLLKNVYTKGTSIRLVLVNVNPAVDYTITLTIVSDTGYAYTDVLGTVKNGVYTKN